MHPPIHLPSTHPSIHPAIRLSTHLFTCLINSSYWLTAEKASDPQERPPSVWSTPCPVHPPVTSQAVFIPPQRPLPRQPLLFPHVPPDRSRVWEEQEAWEEPLAESQGEEGGGRGRQERRERGRWRDGSVTWSSVSCQQLCRHRPGLPSRGSAEFQSFSQTARGGEAGTTMV